jgi:type I restriction enzyme R subunit
VKPITTPVHTEKAFEEAIESQLLEKSGYIKGDPGDFNRELALDTKTIFAFLQESQPEAWEKSLAIHGAGIESKLLQRLTKELDTRGTLDVLRNGFIDYGVRFKMAYFKPASGLNPEAERL